MQLLDRVVGRVRLVLEGTTFAFPPAMRESSCCSTSWSAHADVGVLDFGCSNRCVVQSHYCFNFHVLMIVQCRVSIHTFFAICIYIFGDVSVKIFGPF